MRFIVQFPDGTALQPTRGSTITARVFSLIAEARATISSHPWMSRRQADVVSAPPVELVAGLPTPDYFEIWSVSKAQTELVKFQFSGVGWYQHDSGVVLVTRRDDVDAGDDTLYKFHFWEGKVTVKSIQDHLLALATMPRAS